MSDPKVAAGEEIIESCPLCHVKYSDPVATNIKQKCPDEAGCGRTFLLKVFD